MNILPPLSTDIVNIIDEDLPVSPFLAPSHQYLKTEFRVKETVMNLIRTSAPESLLFITLTMKTPTRDYLTSNKSLTKLMAKIRRVYGELSYVWVAGLTKSKHVHYHLVLELPGNCREGTDFVAFFDGHASAAVRRKAVNPQVREFLDDLESLGNPLGFGKAYVAPLLRPPEAVSRYCGINYWGLQRSRLAINRGARTWGKSKTVPPAPKNSEFTMLTPENREHRRRIAQTALEKFHIRSFDAAVGRFKRKWHRILSYETYRRETVGGVSDAELSPLSEHSAPGEGAPAEEGAAL